VLRSINGVGPDIKGNVNLEATDCYRIERQVNFMGVPPNQNPRKGTIQPGILKLISNCTSCSDCDQYSKLYRLLRKTFLRMANVETRTKIAVNQYTHYLRLLAVLKTYIDTTEVGFRIIQNQDNIFTLHLQLKCGGHAFDRVSLQLTYPVGYTISYVGYSGWEKIPNRKIRQADDLFSPTIGANWQVNTVFPKYGVAWWYWTVKLVPVTDPGGDATPTTNDVQFSATVTARELLPSGGLSNRVFGPLPRLGKLTYPTRPLTYGPFRQP
jgi:hypothetical protein